MSEYQNTLQYLFNLQNRGIKLSLDRVLLFRKALGFPDRAFDSFHIAGTNGKGSTAHFLDAMLRTAPIKVGLYTSPHLVRFNERIRVNGATIPDDFIVRFTRQWRDFIDEYELTFFETTTLMALDYFREQEVDVAILETGLGGRLDATNIVTPIVSLITSIGLEHTDMLGETIADIAREKAGIMNPNVPCVIGTMPPEAALVMAERAGELTLQLISAINLLHPSNISVIPDHGTKFDLMVKGEKHHLRLNMVGRQAAMNAAYAVAALEVQDHYALDWPEQKRAVEQVTIPGRLQRLQESPAVYYDVAHNYDGFVQLMQNLRALHPERDFRFLLSLSELKDISRLHEALPAEASLGIMTIDDMPMHGLAAWEKALPAREISDYGRNAEAVKQWRSDLRNSDIGIIAGSHYIARYVYEGFNFSLDS